MTDRTVLIVDDEPDISELIGMTVHQTGIPFSTANTLEQAKKKLSNNVALCLCDLRLPDGSGMELVEAATQMGVPIAIITAHGNVNSAVQALKLGAFDFLSKPIDNHQLKQVLESALSLPEQGEPLMPLLIGNSTPMMALKALILKVVRSQAPIHISGPSGAGKECVAKTIHTLSSRAAGPFVPINCGAIPATLIESELFGHKKGSFTGAHEDKVGLFEQAQGGTLFLDEVADLPLEMQVKLLRVLQEKKIRPIGSANEVSINVRFLSATAQSLKKMVAKQRFREDLYYRLNVIECPVPALNEHKEDLPELIAHILKTVSSAQPTSLDKSALSKLENYSFPGNVRELENILERAITLSGQKVITAEDLQLSDLMLSKDGSLDDKIEHLEKQSIIDALKRTNGNKKKAAELLGIPYRSLRYRLSKLKLNEDPTEE